MERSKLTSTRPEVETMKKNELSEAASNMLIFSSVSVALTPFLLGDRLIPILTGLVRDGGMIINNFSDYVWWLLS
jgi:hypothetical protein